MCRAGGSEAEQQGAGPATETAGVQPGSAHGRRRRNGSPVLYRPTRQRPPVTTTLL